MNSKRVEEGKRIAGNKLIAEFMGATFTSEDAYGDGKVINYINFAPGNHPDLMIKSSGRKFIDYDLKYHQSFDWLMPIVEKIEAIEDKHHGRFGVHISSNSCTIQATNFRSDKPIANPPHFFSEWIDDTKILATWYAVTYFITWYNQNQLK